MRHWHDYKVRLVRLNDERLAHIEDNHPEMRDQGSRVVETLACPDRVVLSKSDPKVELHYRFYESTPVTKKYLCVAVRSQLNDNFIITAYYTDRIKQGEILWPKE